MKKSHRILRDASIVIVFCVGFVGLIAIANFLQNDSAEQSNSEFSEYRIGADQAARGHDFNVSLKNLKALVENDPFDGRAQYELASALYSRAIEAQDSKTARKHTDLLSPGNQLDPKKRIPLGEIKASDAELSNQVQLLSDQAIQEYKLAEKHPRYRLRSQVQMAVLMAIQGDNEAALDNLEKFVAGGGATMRGLDQIEYFGTSLLTTGPTKLHTNPRFAGILDQEMENRIGRGGKRSRYGRSRPDGFRRHQPRRSGISGLLPTLSQPDTNFYNFLKRLNHDLIPYRIKLVNFIRELFE